jgi:hypothetical protein
VRGGVREIGLSIRNPKSGPEAEGRKPTTTDGITKIIAARAALRYTCCITPKEVADES